MEHTKLFTYSCSYILTPWSRVLLEMLTSSMLVKKFPALYHYSIHKCMPPVPTLSQINPIHVSTSHFLKIHLNIILPYMPGSSKWSLSLRFPRQKRIRTSPLLPYVLCAQPISFLSKCYPNNIGQSTDHLAPLM